MLMVFELRIFLLLVTFPLIILCQTVQDDWTAPAAPDGSTPLQSGTRFSLLWKRSLQNSFAIYCPLCNTTKLDLWITNFNGTKYQSKIGRGIDLTTSTSYDWNVQIASNQYSEKDFWVFRFTFFDSPDPYTQQISSPGFRISGLVKAISTSSVQSSSSTSVFSSSQTSSSIVTTPASVAPSGTSTPQSIEQPAEPDRSSTSKTWIAGVVAGAVVGLGMGAALMWYCLRKRRKPKARLEQSSIGPDQKAHSQRELSSQSVIEKYTHTVKMDSQPWQQRAGHQGHVIAEAPGNKSPTEPSELWHGNYGS